MRNLWISTKKQVDKWIQENVLDNLLLGHTFAEYSRAADEIGGEVVYGEKRVIAAALQGWLSRFDQVEMWGDCLAYDWVLLAELFGGAFSIPKNVYYIPLDICTLFRAKRINPDINREEFAELDGGSKHNALWDARVIKACYEKLTIM